MPYELVIQGGLVEEREYTRRNTMPLKDFLPHLTSYTAFELMPLPTGLKYLKVTPNDTTLSTSLIVEVPPAITMIRFKDGYADSNAETLTYHIGLPYQYFYFRMNSNQMFTATGEQVVWTPEYWGVVWGNQPLTSLDVPAAPAGLPNCYDSGEVCHGTVSVDASDKLGVWVDTAVNTFLTSEFNRDLSYPWPFDSMAEWERHTERDAMDYLNWTWFDGAPTLRQKLQRFNENDWPDLKPSRMDDEPIPEIRNAPSFYNVQEWLLGLTETNRARVIEAAQRMNDG